MRQNTAQRLYASLISLGLFMAQARASSAPLTWYVDDYPPILIQTGPLAGTGPGNKSLSILFAALPSFNHQMVTAPDRRARHDLARENGSCMFPSGAPAERGAPLLYSRRFILVSNIRLIVLSSNAEALAPYLTPSGEISLDRLAHATGLRAAAFLPNARPNALAAFLANPHPGLAITETTTAAQIPGLLYGHRVEFALISGPALSFYDFDFPASEQPRALTIEHIPPRLALHVACSTDKIGAEAMSQIDTLFADQHFWHDFTAPIAALLPKSEFSAP